MPGESVLRVVVVRKGKVKATEFRLRPDEIGLSLFRVADHIDAETLVAAVRAAGKQGDLGGRRDSMGCDSPSRARAGTDSRRNS